MRAELLSIGTELLLGSILNTNARFLSQQLAAHGVDIYQQSTVGDNAERIAKAFETGFARADILITSGGLGPTEDDTTVAGFSRFLEKELVLHSPTLRAIRTRVQKRGMKMSAYLAKQAMVPRGSASIFQNANGTAPGIFYTFTIDEKPKCAILLPGPPRELEPMFRSKALPRLLAWMGVRHYFGSRSLRVACIPESVVAQRIRRALLWEPPLTAGIYAKPGEVEIKLMAKADSQNECRRLIARGERYLRARLGDRIFGVNDDTLSSCVGALLFKTGKTLATAESCTGGLLGHLLTESAGSSAYYLGGMVAYNDRLKTEALGVSEGLLDRFGAVSAPCAKAMALGARKKFCSDHALAITGIAGPGGGSRSKPVGLVYIALAGRDGVRVFKNRFVGSRASIKTQSAQKALNLLRLRLS